MGPITAEITAVAGDDRGLFRHNPRRPYHTGALIQNGIDHHKWNMESPSGGMGSDPRNADHDTCLPGAVGPCRSQEGLEEANLFTPTRQLPRKSKQT